ncbi:hypothetical protein BAUCODRAFT_64305 [Baudoinia panamericana UAMH 10762]|uniref:Cullin family profile domain-containing protein n=1 Tax=Baudoinia panamericana (strain UAMH 10762) TaxID=717646 RepID=M2NMC2_BAUPA|nr:uncharacterized protein BAUCODRAFT_64305 [Baudoinia panamericana UAMH 10762]EMD00331.1 hypothetical protein BAUCODRAFT_64305 [Baudoinia panamericana UAMH 10762]
MLLGDAHLAHVQPALSRLRDRAQQALHTVARNTVPSQRLEKTLGLLIFRYVQEKLALCGDPEDCAKAKHCQCGLNADDLPFAQLRHIGFGDAIGERALALAVDKLLSGPALDRPCYRVDWDNDAPVAWKLDWWTQFCLSEFLENSVNALTGDSKYYLNMNERTDVLANAAGKNFARQRTAAIFEYVKSWPKGKGALHDIGVYSASIEGKAYVCGAFIIQVQTRLLHAGASTIEILSIYTNVIYVFRELDPRGVMLEKVAGPIRNYLRTRDDTVNIIAASFLAATVDAEGVIHIKKADLDKICFRIAVEAAKSSLANNRQQKTLDWNDMAWKPEPVDAGPNHKAAESDDIVTYILGLFDPEDFIKEITTVLAQHLLQATDPEYVKETRLVELLKSRLDATKLQAVEVMLKDMRDSVTLNKRISIRSGDVDIQPPAPAEIRAAMPEEGITSAELYKRFQHRMKQAQFIAMLKVVANKRHDLYYPKRTRLPPDAAARASIDVGTVNDTIDSHPDIRVQVLSSFFWPQMRANEFHLPRALADLEQKFNDRFASLGNQRKLRYRHALSRVTVRLALEDRNLEHVDVPAWRASVIDAFLEEPTVTAEQLAQGLGMEEDLVQDALAFWTANRVLYQPTPGSYAVLERLDMDNGDTDPTNQQQPQPVEPIPSIVSQDDMLKASAPMFETFIANMLRNGGPKEVGGMMGITSMMKMVLPTFTFGGEETKWLLLRLEGRGEVVRHGDTWAAAG